MVCLVPMIDSRICTINQIYMHICAYTCRYRHIHTNMRTLLSIFALNCMYKTVLVFIKTELHRPGLVVLREKWLSVNVHMCMYKSVYVYICTYLYCICLFYQDCESEHHFCAGIGQQAALHQLVGHDLAHRLPGCQWRPGALKQ